MRRLAVLLVLVGSFVTAGVLMAPQPALAATSANCTGEVGGFLDFPTWYKYLDYSFDSNTNSCNINNFEFPRDIGKVLLAVVEILLRISGLIAVGFVIYGGIRYVLSLGNPENTKNARSTIINALIGLLIAASATAIVNLVAGNLL